MSKRRLTFALLLGLVLAVFVSACGVALGPVQFTAAGPAVMNPTINGLHMPGLAGLHERAVMGSMQHIQNLTAESQALSYFGHVGGCHELP